MEVISDTKQDHGDFAPRGLINMFDKPSAIFAAIVLGFAGTGVAMGMPLLVGSMAKSLGFSEQQLGWLASSDMAGLCAGSILAALMVTKINRRVLAATGLLLVILANYLSTQSPDLLPLMLSRLFAGIGAGICYSTCTASLAGSHNAARTFSILLFVLVVMNAFIFYIFPIIEGRWGVNGLFLFYLLEAVPILLILPWLPRYCSEQTDQALQEQESGGATIQLAVPEILPRLCLDCRFHFLSFGGSVLGFYRASGHRCKHKRRVYFRDANLGAVVQPVRRCNHCVACTTIWPVKTLANGIISDDGHHVGAGGNGG